jgi:TPR repeat protein
MFEPQGVKIMFDLHGLGVKEVKKLLNENFAKINQLHIGEFYIITGRGNHTNSNGTHGVLKKILPKLLKPYCQAILQVNKEEGAYKIILKPQQEVNELKDLLISLCTDEDKCIEYAKILHQRAANHDIESLLALATIHLHQAIKGFDNKNEGIRLLEKAKQLGSVDAEVQLGVLYHEGLIVKQQHEKAFKHFREAATKKHPLGQYYLAVCYLQGKGVKYNDKQALAWMKKAADQGDAYAQDALGDFYLLGKITTQNYKLGIKYKKKAAEQGLAEAQIDLARCYATGYGVEQNYQTAFDYYLAAAHSNKPYAVYQVGMYLLDGRLGTPDITEAFNWFLRAAELGDADGQAQVGYQYLFGGLSVEQNIEKGMEWTQKAVDQKNRYGYYAMAEAYQKGIGVEQNDSKANDFMKLSADAGYAPAQEELENSHNAYNLGSTQLELTSYFDEISLSDQESDDETIQSSYGLKFETVRIMNQGKALESAADYYCLGELAYLLLTIAWYTTNPIYKKQFQQEYSILYSEFVKRANQLEINPPKKKSREKITEYLLRYIDALEISLKENRYDIETIYFNLGFKIMAVKMMEFTHEDDDLDIVEQLVNYLKYMLRYPQLINIDKLLIDKIENMLYKQLYKTSKDFAANFDSLEKQLKEQLQSPTTAPTPLDLNTYSTQLVRYSIWSKKALTIGLAATAAIGIALVQRKEIAETAKSICKLQ